jgi:hypothetical protein
MPDSLLYKQQGAFEPTKRELKKKTLYGYFFLYAPLRKLPREGSLLLQDAYNFLELP